MNRDESHLTDTGWQAVAMIERTGADDIFVHLDTYHMNIEEKGAANGILAARHHLRDIHLAESDRGVPGQGTCDWDEIFATLAAIGFRGGLAMESFIKMPPELAFGLSVWRPVADSTEQVIGECPSFPRRKVCQNGQGYPFPSHLAQIPHGGSGGCETPRSGGSTGAPLSSSARSLQARPARFPCTSRACRGRSGASSRCRHRG